MLKVIFGIILQVIFINSMMDPAKLMDHLQNICPKQLELLTMDIGRTINGRTILAYGITKIKGMKENPQLMNTVPSTLLTSYLHLRDEHSVDLLLSYFTSAILGYSKDYYLSYVLETGMIWIIPFINIDAYEQVIRNKKLDETQPENKEKYTKNRHLYPVPNHKQLCSFDYLNGVNIDKNFMRPESQRMDPCTLQYGGPQPFSEKQSLAVSAIFNHLRIVTLIDFQAKGNEWIYPYSIDKNHQKLKNHPFYSLYSDIISKLKKAGYSVGNKIQLYGKPSNQGFLQWAASQGVLAFTHMVGHKFVMTKQQSQLSHKKSFPVIDMLIKKACPIYQKYRDPSGNIIAIKSLSVQPFNISIEISLESDGFAKNMQKMVPSGKGILVQFDKYLKRNQNEIIIKIQIRGTLLKEQIKFSDIKVNQAEIKEIQRQIYQQQQVFTISKLIKIVVLAGCLIRIGWYIIKQCIIGKKTRKKNFEDQDHAQLIV